MRAIGKLFPYMKPYAMLALLGPLLMSLEVVMDLIQPLFMQKIIDVGIAESNHRYVIQYGLFMLISAVFGLIGGAGSSIYAARSAVHFATDIRRDLFKKTMQFSKENTDSFGTGKLITIVSNDVVTLQHAVIMTLRIFVRGPLLFIGSVVIVWFTARELFPILLVSIPILAICIYYFSAKSGKLFGHVQKALDAVNSKMQEYLAGIRVIKAFDRYEYENSRFRKVNDSLTAHNLTAEKFIITLMPVTMFIVNLGIVAGLWLGVIKVNAGLLEVGVIIAFINYLNIMMNGLMSSTHVLMSIARAFPSAERIVDVLETDVHIIEKNSEKQAEEIQGELEFSNVSFSYSKNGEYVLKDLSFKVEAGQTIGMIGPTGSGKSTLVKLIPRLYDPDEGEILLDGKNIKEYSLAELRAAIGFVPQTALLFSGTVAHNLRFGKEDATEIELNEAADSAAASEFIERFEQKYEHELMQGATNVSGGQKQRLSMARAFIRKPRLLILDDSTSAIDAMSEALVQETLQRSFPDATILIISAKVSSIIHADQIFVMNEGEIVAKGTHEELVASSEMYQAIYASQSGKGVTVNEQ